MAQWGKLAENGMIALSSGPLLSSVCKGRCPCRRKQQEEAPHNSQLPRKRMSKRRSLRWLLLQQKPRWSNTRYDRKPSHQFVQYSEPISSFNVLSGIGRRHSINRCLNAAPHTCTWFFCHKRVAHCERNTGCDVAVETGASRQTGHSAQGGAAEQLPGLRLADQRAHETRHRICAALRRMQSQHVCPLAGSSDSSRSMGRSATAGIRRRSAAPVSVASAEGKKLA